MPLPRTRKPAPDTARDVAAENVRLAATAAEAARIAKLPESGEDVLVARDGDDDAEVTPAERPQGRASKAAVAPPKVAPVLPAPARAAARAAFVEGRAVKAGAQTDDVVRFKRAEFPNFILTHDPARWGYYPQVKKILPDFGKIRLVPGIGRVDRHGAPDGALVDASKTGRVVIYDRDVPGGYLREYDMIGGVGFLPSWERVKSSGRGATIEVDFGAFEAVVDQLLTDGKIQPPDETTIAMLRDAAKNMINMCEPRKEQPRVAAEIAMYREQIAACDALEEG